MFAQLLGPTHVQTIGMPDTLKFCEWQCYQTLPVSQRDCNSSFRLPPYFHYSTLILPTRPKFSASQLWSITMNYDYSCKGMDLKQSWLTTMPMAMKTSRCCKNSAAATPNTDEEWRLPHTCQPSRVSLDRPGFHWSRDLGIWDLGF